MNVLQVERETIAGKLTAAGVAAVTLDPTGPLPCVLVDAPSIDAVVGVGGWDATFPVVAIAAPPGNAAALAWLLDQVELVVRTFVGATATPTTVPRNDRDCPAYTIPLTRSLANPDC